MDREAAKKLYVQMMEEEKQKMSAQKTFEETDAVRTLLSLKTARIFQAAQNS